MVLSPRLFSGSGVSAHSRNRQLSVTQQHSNLWMTSMNSRKPVSSIAKLFFLLLVSWALLQTSVRAQSSAFTYQGNLAVSTSPANGAHDFQFKLFDALTGGTQIGLINSATNTVVTSGLFIVTLDFGATAFPGAPRWLEISVRPTGGGSYTTLSPRQPVTATPYAVKSLNAANADTLSAACVGCVTGAQIGALPTGSGNYIQNTATPQASSSFNISGNGTAAGILSGNVVNATTQFNLNGNRLISTGPPTGLNNFLAGLIAGNSLMNNRENTFIGNEAGQATTGGSLVCSNCGPGGASLHSGSHNSFTGYRAGASNTTGYSNSFFGDAAGYTNTTGVNNSFFGYVAGYSNFSGFNNSFFGYLAGASNTDGDFNSFFGERAGTSNLTGGANSFFGSTAGDSNTTGGNNSFFGSKSGSANTIGSNNSFFGEKAGETNTSGSQNVMLGAGADFRAITFAPAGAAGDYNLFVGYQSGGDSARRNSAAIGTRAFVACDDCMVLGSSAVTAYKVGIGTNTPSAKLDVNGGNTLARIAINSDSPTANAGIEFRLNNAKEWTIATANAQGDLIFFDESPGAGARMHIVGGTGATGGFVGIGTTAPADKLHVTGDIRIGTGAFGCVKDADGTVIAGLCSSDRRFKRDITPFPSLLDKLVKLQPVNFFWRSSEFPQRSFGDRQSYGLIAQEVEAVLPELVSTDAEGFKAVNYSKLPLLLLQGIKDQQQLSQQLKQENAELKQQLAEQQLRFQRQESEFRELKRLVCLSAPQADACQPPK